MLGPETRLSLIVQLKDPTALRAWEEFVQLYQSVIYRVAFKPIRFEPAHEDVGESGCPVLWLVRENDRWWIKDMDMAAEKHALQQLADWEEKN